MEFILIIGNFDSRTFCDFSPVAKVNIIGECKFPKMHESEKPVRSNVQKRRSSCSVELARSKMTFEGWT